MRRRIRGGGLEEEEDFNSFMYLGIVNLRPNSELGRVSSGTCILKALGVKPPHARRYITIQKLNKIDMQLSMSS